MSYEQLLATLKDMLAQAKRVNVWFSAIERVNLLPALQAMHDKVARPGQRIDRGERDPAQPNWSDVCRSLGISPDLVRVWRQRTQAHTDIRHLLGEQPPTPRISPGQRNREAVRHLQVLVTTVLNGDEQQAEAVALALAERYGF